MASSGSTNSGSTNSGSTNGGSTNGGSTNGGSTGGGTDISSLNSGLTDLQKNGPVDLKLSTQTRDAYLDIVKTFHDALNTQLTTIKNLPSLGDPGTLGSAIQTKNNLALDISGLDGIEQSVNQYLSYLQQFSATVKAAADRLTGAG
ncbi:hypothetical protein [Mycobacterium simiae]|uniref:hypothetical protein n=1 Tax=Mycobacterium simiae TaxID=1784 RepID=UPI00111BDB63|nr:hypothetical protein [Mycobacterium simiae]